MKNWNAYDSTYSVPSFYKFNFSMRNTTSKEWFSLESPEGAHLRMESNTSNRLGPSFFYRWIGYGYSIDLNTIGKPSKRKNEFTLSINSNLFNIDLIRRRTGGDFNMRDLNFDDPILGRLDMLDMAKDYDLGDCIKNSLTGVNVSYFVNHLRYSNPAAFSNGAIQIRSAGSPIIGFGFTHQKIESDVSDIFATAAVELMTLSALADGSSLDELGQLIGSLSEEDEITNDELLKVLDLEWPSLKYDEQVGRVSKNFLTNRIPTQIRIDDWHLQLGYAYNHVFSRRLLLGVSLVAAPGLKRLRTNNIGSPGDQLAEGICELARKHEGTELSPDYFRYSYDATHLNVNFFGRASLTYNYNHWVAGLNASFSHYHYNHGGMHMKNTYGNVCLYLGYCFALKKEYRKGGTMRRHFERLALNPKW